MNVSDRRRRLRAVLARNDCVNPASVFDPLSARAAEEAGYEVGMLPGSVAALVVLGAPDIVVLTLTELAALARRICRACDLPLVVDADHGYGNALNVKRTVEELEAAGVAGLTIEDTLLPAPFGDHAKARMVSLDEGLGKIRAAIAGRQDQDLVLIARTAAPLITDLADAITRIQAYAAAGADAVFLLGVANDAQLEAVSKAVTVPIIFGNTGTGPFARATLAAHGVRMLLQGNQPYFAALEAARKTLEALRQGTPPKQVTGLLSDDSLKRLARDPAYRAAAKEWLGG